MADGSFAIMVGAGRGEGVGGEAVGGEAVGGEAVAGRAAEAVAGDTVETAVWAVGASAGDESGGATRLQPTPARSINTERRLRLGVSLFNVRT